MPKLETKKTFRETFYANFKTLLSAALGFISALAWNDAFQSLIRLIFPKEALASLMFKFLYALAVTTLAVVVYFSLTRLERHWQKIRSNQTKKN